MRHFPQSLNIQRKVISDFSSPEGMFGFETQNLFGAKPDE